MRAFTIATLTLMTSILWAVSAQAQYDVGTTAGTLDVSSNGGAGYTVPIAVPPGVRDIAPSVALSFNSQSGNALAGWGWSISGLSAITRVGATPFHDGINDGVDFDAYDRFALDGERLIRTKGTYGKDGSEYATENYSNIKVIAYGVNKAGAHFGPNYFRVYQPDGSFAQYENITDRGETGLQAAEWVVTYTQDQQGNRIHYSYYGSREGVLLKIKSITYGGPQKQREGHPNEIKFIYKERSQPEVGYAGGAYRFERSYILGAIEVLSQGQRYRKYTLTHRKSTLGYELVDQIQESNGEGDQLEPVKFTYGQRKSYNIAGSKKTLTTTRPVDDYTRALSGDFDADGTADFVIYHEKSQNFLETFLQQDGYRQRIRTNVAPFVRAGTAVVRDAQDRLMLGQSIVTQQTNGNGGYTFRGYYANNQGELKKFYEKSWADPEHDGTAPKEMFLGNFTGDGTTRAVLVQNDNSEVYLANLGPRNPTGFVVRSGYLEDKYESNEDAFQVADFDGDGKDDLWHFQVGELDVYKFAGNQLQRIARINDGLFNVRKRQVYTGDYNGDGKADVLVPEKEGSTLWHYFISRGNTWNNGVDGVDYTAFKKITVESGLKYDRSEDWVRVHFIAQDINQDGKTDMIQHILYRVWAAPDNHSAERHAHHQEKILVYANGGAKDSYRMRRQDQADYERNGFSEAVMQGIPIFLETDPSTDNPEYAIIRDKRIESYRFDVDHREETRLYTIKNNHLTHRIVYDEFKDGNSTYEADEDVFYPYLSIENARGSKLVKQIIEEGSEITRKRDFKYKGAITHLQGFGFMGFRVLKDTEWYGKNIPKLWNINRYALRHRQRLVEKSWKSTSDNNDDYFSLIKYTYKTQRTNGIIINKPTEIETIDRLAGFATTETLQYDQFWNPTQITVQKPGATVTTKYDYSNNGSVAGGNYHRGRVVQERVVSEISGDKKTLQHDYTYHDESGQYDLVEKKVTTYQDTDDIREKFVYDAFGNVVEKSVNADGVKKRTETFNYSKDGRFMVASTSIEGKKTTYAYDAFSGNPSNSTDHLGQTITTRYDGWGRTTSETDYLGNKTTYRYENDKNGMVRYETTGPDGSRRFSTQDAFGVERYQGSKSFNGQYVIVRTDYDASGRKTRESEPHYASETPQWNTYAYDPYGRIITLTAFTGKTVKTSYDGLSATVTDETKSVITTKDTHGHVVQVTDPGGTVKYNYDAHGHLLKTNYEGYQIRMTYDAVGNKTKLVDPSAGTYRYAYDKFGQLLEETSPKGTTTYTYDDFGKVLSKKVVGDLTNISEKYSYDPKSRLITQRSGTSNQEAFTYTYKYDDHYRPIKVKETNEKAIFSHQWTYDKLGRASVETYRSKLTQGKAHEVSQQNMYGKYGHLVAIRGGSTTVWELQEENARGQVLKAQLGNGMLQTTRYDAYGFVERIRDHKTQESDKIVAVNSHYTFDPKTGRLLTRTNKMFNQWTEAFSYDPLNRLTKVEGDVNDRWQYDERGRMQKNSQVGEYLYASGSNYQLANIDLNRPGRLHYQEHPLHQVTYNAFKKPVSVRQPGYGNVDYEYSPELTRSHAYYGNEKSKKSERRFHKHYASIFPGEIVEDRQKHTAKWITYLGGDAYSAPAASVEIRKGAEVVQSGLVYLHRDYLGSIVALTDEEGQVIERTHYGAWGTVDHYHHRDSIAFGYETLLQRGYTGHEHFTDIGLIHMNGRMYDAKLGRFLSPDNYVQDPGNTQNYNRYGYAYNNPLMYTDPSGEFFLAAIGWVVGALVSSPVVAAFIVGGTSAVLFNGASNIINGQSFFSGAGSAFLFGGITGVLSFGIGQTFASGGALGSYHGGILHHGAHGLTGGIMAELQGGNFGSGFASGFISHTIAAKTNKLTVGAHPRVSIATTLASGTLVGGISSRLSGGSWVMGLRQGFSSTLLNEIVSKEATSAIRRFHEVLSSAEAGDALGLPYDVPSSFQVGDRPHASPGARIGIDPTPLAISGVTIRRVGNSPSVTGLISDYLMTKSSWWNRHKPWQIRLIGLAYDAGNLVSAVANSGQTTTYYSLYQEVYTYPAPVVGSKYPYVPQTVPTGRFVIRPGKAVHRTISGTTTFDPGPLE